MQVLVPQARFERWVLNFHGNHGDTAMRVDDGVLSGTASDGSRFAARLPLGQAYAGPPTAADFTHAITPIDDWGVLLVRKGGFAIARLAADRLVDHKIGQRHVQGRTKAGGQSQQRFARRRGNQARQAFEAAAEHTVRILGTGQLVVVAGGDRAAVEEVLSDPRLSKVAAVAPWLPVPDPKRVTLEQAVVDAASAQIEVVNA